MKKLVLSCLAVLLISGAASAQLSYGPELGINFSNYRVHFGGFFPPVTVPLPGAHAGGVLNYAFSDHMAIEPGAFFSINGIKYRYSVLGIAQASVSAHINTIHIPLNVIYTFNGAKGRFFAGAGPFLGINLGGSAKLNATVAGLSAFGVSNVSFDTSGKATAGNNPDDFIKTFDFGVGAHVGYMFTSGFFIRGGYSRGFLDLAPDKSYTGITTMRSSGYSLSVGYLIGHKKKGQGPAQPKKKTH